MLKHPIAFLIGGDVEVTQTMIDAGVTASDRMHKADCISCMDGLGGGMKMADAPPEIAQYFGRPERSSTLLMFQAMDAESASPFGTPTQDMTLVGEEILVLMVDAAFVKGILKNHPDTDVSDVRPDVLLLAQDKRTPVHLMYLAMIMSTQPVPVPEKTAVRIHREESKALFMASVIVTGEAAAKLVCSKLLAESAFFSCTPLPEDEFEFSVKADRAPIVEALALEATKLQPDQTP